MYKAEVPLSLIHKHIETSIKLVAKFPNCVQGFTSRRSIVTNASHHLGKKWVLSCDIQSFFKSIQYDSVAKAFLELGANLEVAEILAKLCTIDGVLEEGLSASPIIANIVCRSLDEDCLKLAQNYGATFTRYADDLTFSGNGQLPSRGEIAHIMESHGFNLHPQKFRIRKRGHGQFVTGLSVAESDRPRISKRIKKRLRLELYYAKKFGIENHFAKRNIVYADKSRRKFINKLIGWARFMHVIEPKMASTTLISVIALEKKEGKPRASSGSVS